MSGIRQVSVIQCQLKLRLRPAQERMLNRWLWRLTGVYNWAILKINHDAANGIYWSLFDLKALLNGHSRKVGIPISVLRGTAAQAHDAWGRCFKKLGQRPRLKGRRNRFSSIPFSDGMSAPMNGRISLPVLGRVRFHAQDIPAGHVGCGRIVRRASGWYLCLFIHAEPQAIPIVADGQVGIDPGFSALLTLSTGEVIEHPRELEAGAERLAQAQRGGRTQIAARLQERQANRRKDRNHKLSRRLVSENAVIAWSRDHTKGVARKFGKSVSSSSHSQLRSQLAYKSRTGGRQFIEVDSRNSTRRCSVCRALTGPAGWAGLKVRQWTCAACGAAHGRDSNAAMNTLIAGLGMSPKGHREVSSGIATEYHGEVQVGSRSCRTS